jgi:hypothetical protein
MQIEITAYDLPLTGGDTVKVRTTKDVVEDVDVTLVGQRGTVIGTVNLVMVQFGDGRVETFNREQVSFKGRGNAPPQSKPTTPGDEWKQG